VSTESPDPGTLDPCGCCEAGDSEPSIHNSPGQPALTYRIGSHGSFLQRLKERLSTQKLPDGDNAGQRPLQALTSRSTRDPAIALLDAWSCVADVLTFYQERIANEGFLRTAGERRSVLEMARAIGYELNPGVSAGTWLAFTVDENEQTPDETVIAAGTQVQSIPQQEGELPQVFETSEDFSALADWNALYPQLYEFQSIDDSSMEILLSGTGLNLVAGDRLLLVGQAADGSTEALRRRIRAVKTDTDHHHTKVTLEAEPTAGASMAAAGTGSTMGGSGAALAIGSGSSGFVGSNVDLLLESGLSEAELQAAVKMRGWSMDDVLDYAGTKPRQPITGAVQIYVMRERAAIFGHNAPYFLSLPEEIRKTSSTDTGKAFQHDWDVAGSPWVVWNDSITGTVYSDGDLYLERPVEGVQQDSFLLLEHSGDYDIYRISSAQENSITGFAISSKATRLELVDLDGGGPTKHASFPVRRTTAYLINEELDLAPVPVIADLAEGATTLTLNNMVSGLQEGQAVAISGEQANADGVQRVEIRILDSVSHAGGLTTLTFTEGLQNAYKRDTVTLSANLVKATHGETVPEEVLGGGDGAVTNQTFTLNKPPLTHVSAANASGAQSTLSIRVNGVQWNEVPSLYGSAAQDSSYIVRLDNEGDVSVIFGDGLRGARLPTGLENVRAEYRSGIGADGEVAAETLTLMKKRPFGVKQVTNPVAPVGAQDPESLKDARDNAPLTVLTLDRIVSLRDFEDFARSFAGIGKAQAVALWHGQSELVHLTIADADGDTVESTSELYENLSDAIDNARDPLREVEISGYQPRLFNLKAKLLIDAAYRWDDVSAAVQAVLQQAYTFERRAFAEAVTAAQLMATIHGVDGVTAVDLDELYPVDEFGAPTGALDQSVLIAESARPRTAPVDLNDRFLPAELLLINEFGITLEEMAS